MLHKPAVFNAPVPSFLVRTQGDSTMQYPRVLTADTEPNAATVPEAHWCPLGGDSIPHVPGDAE